MGVLRNRLCGVSETAGGGGREGSGEKKKLPGSIPHGGAYFLGSFNRRLAREDGRHHDNLPRASGEDAVTSGDGRFRGLHFFRFETNRRRRRAKRVLPRNGNKNDPNRVRGGADVCHQGGNKQRRPVRGGDEAE